MIIVMILYLFLIGSVLGSFFNVVGIRVPRRESIIRPRSHCSICKRNLTAADLVPIFSYLFLKGKCRKCGTRISPLYPLVEAGTGLLFVASFLVFGWTGEMIVSLVLMSMLAIIFVSDIRYMIIPNKVLLFFAPLFLALRLVWIPLDPWWDALVGAGIGFGLLLMIAVVSRGGMGGGDIKLFAVLGLVLGWQGTLLAFFFSCLFGALIGGVGLLVGKVERRKPIPFGPFIVLGTITAYFFGSILVEWYLSRFIF
ncbi:prepilin peptidase [Halalkalibacter nanhaiisediminis]|uniref:Prepilin leader peptidase/N-methyltransferase n=1 Tax=Halalkalibacter nanhaiisediminis TaxID=688079 RepID=A0A562QK06_9BACI|nr:A24 family peptidase [Halalkalibacter nanhaiisediminis]TWI57097.1 leader peptidase (prepilin peptidase)/N-methyltransferase [Halalkalibacter nanhaiisediminis]